MSFSNVRFAVRLTPRSAVERVEDVVDGVLKVRVMAPAVEGAANASLIRILADELGIARRDVRIVAGAASRQKLVVVEGVDAGGDRRPLAGPPGMIAVARCVASEAEHRTEGRLGDHLGRLAQRLERTVHIREVTGSNPVSPTTWSAVPPDSNPSLRPGNGMAAASASTASRSDA